MIFIGCGRGHVICDWAKDTKELPQGGTTQKARRRRKGNTTPCQLHTGVGGKFVVLRSVRVNNRYAGNRAVWQSIFWAAPARRKQEPIATLCPEASAATPACRSVNSRRGRRRSQVRGIMPDIFGEGSHGAFRSNHLRQMRIVIWNVAGSALRRSPN